MSCYSDGALSDLSKSAPPGRAAKAAPTTPHTPQVHQRGYKCSPTFGTEASPVGTLEDSSVEGGQSPFPPESDFVLFPEEMDHTLSPHSVDMGQMCMEQSHVYSACALFGPTDTMTIEEHLNTQAKHSEHTRKTPKPTISWKEFDEAMEALLTRSPITESSQMNTDAHSASRRINRRYSHLQQWLDENAHSVSAATGSGDAYDICDNTKNRHERIRFAEARGKFKSLLDREDNDKPCNRLVNPPEHHRKVTLRDLGVYGDVPGALAYEGPSQWFQEPGGGNPSRHESSYRRPHRDDLPHWSGGNTLTYERDCHHPPSNNIHHDQLHCLQTFTGPADSNRQHIAVDKCPSIHPRYQDTLLSSPPGPRGVSPLRDVGALYGQSRIQPGYQALMAGDPSEPEMTLPIPDARKPRRQSRIRSERTSGFAVSRGRMVLLRTGSVFSQNHITTLVNKEKTHKGRLGLYSDQHWPEYLDPRPSSIPEERSCSSIAGMAPNPNLRGNNAIHNRTGGLATQLRKVAGCGGPRRSRAHKTKTHPQKVIIDTWPVGYNSIFVLFGLLALGLAVANLALLKDKAISFESESLATRKVCCYTSSARTQLHGMLIPNNG
jgi:hypothetical protein